VVTCNGPGSCNISGCAMCTCDKNGAGTCNNL
jgi:hypothetical protein